jgi:uncharacterized protein YjbJ (UPF0337 family)
MPQAFKFSGLGHIDYQETNMNKNEIQKNQIIGRVDEGEGKVKQAVGVLLDDKDLEIKDKVHKNIGKLRSEYFDCLTMRILRNNI